MGKEGRSFRGRIERFLPHTSQACVIIIPADRHLTRWFLDKKRAFLRFMNRGVHFTRTRFFIVIVPGDPHAAALMTNPAVYFALGPLGDPGNLAVRVTKRPKTFRVRRSAKRSLIGT